MKTISKIFGGLSLFIISASVFSAAFELPDYKRVVLKNGLTLILLEQKEVPLVSIDVRVKAGAIHSDIIGLPAVAADSLGFGSGKLSKQDFDKKAEFVGAKFGSGAGKEQSFISASFAKKDVSEMMPLFRDFILKPQFDQVELDKYLTRYAANIEQRKESPKTVISDYFNHMIYGQHPYAVSTTATNESLTKIHRQTIMDFYKNYYQPSNTVMVIAGDINARKMKKRINKLFGKWKDSKTVPSVKVGQIAKLTSANVMLVDKPDAIETTFQFGGVGIARNHPDFVAISVINTILGGRFTSWLNDELRVNTGLTYGARSRFSSMSQGGSFYISTFTKQSSTEAALDLALKTYQRLWNKGLTQSDLDSAKSYVKGQFPPRYETAGQVAGLLADMEVMGISKDFINGFNASVDSLTVEKSKQLINQYFPKDNLQFVLIGKAEAIRDIAKKYGKVTETSIKD
jgi:zinc protease